MEKTIKIITLPLIILLFALTFILAFTVVLLIIALIPLGLLSIAVSLGVITGILSNIATNLSPPAMLLAGVFCVFSALALIMTAVISVPKTIKLFQRIWEWFRLSENSL